MMIDCESERESFGTTFYPNPFVGLWTSVVAFEPFLMEVSCSDISK